VNYSNPIEVNRYGYAAGNPVNLSDPSGLQAFAEWGGKNLDSLKKGSAILTPLRVFVGGALILTAIYFLVAYTFPGGVIRDLPQEKTLEQIQMEALWAEYLRLRQYQNQPTPQAVTTVFPPLLPTITLPTPQPTPTGQTIVELGSGDFSNLIRIKKQYPYAEIVGYEEMLTSFARLYPENYYEAISLGIKITSQDYGMGIVPADIIIAIAPPPDSETDIVNAVLSGAKQNGTLVYIATGLAESTGEDIRNEFIRRGIAVPPLVTQPSLYPSNYLGLGEHPVADVLTFMVNQP
jgi:hypothetical protein